jgi:pSer/pThr/pTyr-binding forkhead associated (FHA) protein
MGDEERAAIRAAAEDEPQGKPFLIIMGGQRHVDLTQPIVTIGRGLDNDVILENHRVSRHHAQLRRRYGRYILYDLGSSGGTTINDYPVQECVLQAGDVISFAGAQVIYGDDSTPAPPDPQEGDTPAMSDPQIAGGPDTTEGVN